MCEGGTHLFLCVKKTNKKNIIWGCELSQYRSICLCLAFVDGGQQCSSSSIVYRKLPPHRVVVLGLYETRLVYWG